MDEKPTDRISQGERLQQAASYYRNGNYADALLILDELARERPDSRHVMYSRGLCLAAIGHVTEALEECERLRQCKGHTAEELSAKLRAKIVGAGAHKDEDSEPRGLAAALPRVNLISLMRQPVGLLVFAVMFTGAILLAAALKGDPTPHQAEPRPIAYASMPKDLRAQSGGYLEIPVCYLPGQAEPVKYAIVFCPPSETDPAAPDLDDTLGSEVAANWNDIRAQVDEALKMAVQQPEPIEGVARSELRRVALIPRQGLSLAGNLQGKTVERFVPGPAKTLRDLAARAGAPDIMALWSQGTALGGIEGDVCWWGRLGIATDENGVITHLVVSVPPDPADEQDPAQDAPTDEEQAPQA